MSTQKTIEQWVDEYLSCRASLGFEDLPLKKSLPQFARYVRAHSDSGRITAAIAMEWATSSKRTGLYYRRRLIGQVRGLARYVAVYDPATEIPDIDVLGRSTYRLAPYIYSDEDIRRMITEAARGPDIVPFWSKNTFPTIIGLLTCTGMRVGEALKMKIDDVDLVHGSILIRESKSRPLRRIAIHRSVMDALSCYLDSPMPAPARSTLTFFRRERGMPIESKFIDGSFRYLRVRARLDSQPGKRKPRLYDLRHTFACRRLLSWYREGRNVNKLLPALSAYLGHSEIDDTYWYLTATPELMAACSQRMAAFIGEGRSV